MTDKQLALYLEQLIKNLGNVVKEINDDLIDRGIVQNTANHYVGPTIAPNIFIPNSMSDLNNAENWKIETIDQVSNLQPLWDLINDLNTNVNELLNYGDVDATDNTAR